VSDKPVKINLPKDPIVLGKTITGEPIWMDPKDLIPTQEEQDERWDKTLNSRQQAMIDNAAELVLGNSCVFVEQTLVSVEPRFASVPGPEIIHFAAQSGFEVIQDGLKTTVKRRGRILREMTANIPPRWRDHVAKKVNELIAGKVLRG
jgi:hypothetical protein